MSYYECAEELTAALLRRVLVATGFEYTDQLFWREDEDGKPSRKCHHRNARRTA